MPPRPALSAPTIALALAMLALGSGLPAAPAQAKRVLPALSLAPGGTIHDRNGDLVGTISQVGNGGVTISTGSQTAILPLSAIRRGPKGPTIHLTRTELDEQVARALRTAAERAATAAPR